MSDEKKAKTKKARKGRVLHTRVPEVLEEELKQVARSLRIPVSNLVRTILEDAVATTQAVGRVAEEELHGAADRIARERARWGDAAKSAGRAARASVAAAEAESAQPESVAVVDEPAAEPDRLAGVIGFQPLVMAVSARCDGCNKELEPGDDAFLGVCMEPGRRVIVGPECVPGRE